MARPNAKRLLILESPHRVDKVRDTFTRPDSSTSLEVAESGQAWSALNGTWGISGLQAANFSGGATEQQAVIDSLLADCIVEATFSVVAAEFQRLVFRASDGSNYLFVANQHIADGTKNAYLSLWTCVAGVFTALVEGAHAWQSGDIVRVVLAGPSIQAYVNGVLIASTTETFNQAMTKHGIGVNNGTTCRFDNFHVRGLG